MYPDKTYTRKIDKYQHSEVQCFIHKTYFTQDYLYCDSLPSTPPPRPPPPHTSLLIAMVYLRKGGEHCFHQYCMDFIAISLFTQEVLYLQCLLGQQQQFDRSYKKGSVHPSLSPGVFLELDHQFFLKFGMVLETQMNWWKTEPDFF